MINRYKSKEGGTMIPAQFQKGGSNLFLTMPDGGTVGPMGASPTGLPEYQVGANLGGVGQKTMQDFNHYYNPGFPLMAEGGDTDMDGDDQSFYSNRINTFIQKIRDNAESNLESAVMQQDQQPPMAAYGMSMQDTSMDMYNPGNLGAFGKTASYMKGLTNNAFNGYIQRMGALGPNDYYYKEKNIYKDTSKNAPFGTQTFTDADGNKSQISPEEAYNRANYALYSKKHGGGLPRAQKGIDWEGISNPELLRRAQEMGHNSVEEYRNSGWGYGKNSWEYKAPPTYPSRVHINDPRTINATSGNPINPNVDLKSGDYHTGVIGEIARAARAYGQNPQELMAIALQETNLGKTDPNYGHVIHYNDPEGRGSAYDLALAKAKKDELATSKGFGNNELLKLQAYNGLGTVYPSTEAGYHGFNMSSIYGVPLTGAGINMTENPLYGKRIVDLRDNVLKNSQNAEYNQFLDKYNRDLANEEAQSQKQIAAYDLFNRINPEYGQQYATMLQNAYADSLSNSSNSEYIYPGGDLDFGYSVPNLDNTRQRNALDRFNRGIGYEQVQYKNGGALAKYQGQDGSSTTGDNYWSADELAYLKGLPKTERDKITAQGDKGRDAYNAYRKANDKAAPSGASATANNTGTTANNTGTTTTTGTSTTNPTSTTTATTKPGPFDGWEKHTIRGVEYPVDPSGRIVGYPYQTETGYDPHNNYNPYAGYNPYNPYMGYTGNRNLGVISKNKLTPEFKQNMLAGSYGNPQLLGVSEIKTRRAMDPGNRVKSITYSYGQPIPSGRTTINQPTASNSTQTTAGSPKSNNGVKPKSPVVDPNDPRVVSPGVKAAEDYTLRPNQNWDTKYQDLPNNGPSQDQLGPRDTPSPDQNVAPFQSQYIPGSPDYPNVPGYGTNGIPATPIVGPSPVQPSGSNPNVSQTSSYNIPAYDANRAFGQISDNEQKYFSTEGDMSNPDWRSQKMDNYGSMMYDNPNKVATKWSGIKDEPVNVANPNGLTKDQVLAEYDKVPAPLKEIATDHLFNSGSDPRIFTLAAAGAIKMEDSAKYKNDPKLLEDEWAKNIGLINQQYKDDPQAFTSAVSDYRKLIYRKSRQRDDQFGNPTDTPSNSGMPGLQYNAWAGRTGNTQDYIDQTYFNPANGYTAPQYFKKDGGALHKFMRMYQGDLGPSSVRDMSIADMPETIDQPVAPESNNTPMEFKPYEMTDADRINAVDKGTEYEQMQPGDGMAPAFDVETKRRKKRIGNPLKDLAAINFATNLFKGRDAAYAATEYGIRSTAANNFNTMRSTHGNYDLLSGDFRRGKRAADGNDAFHSGFGTYAQMGGNMLQNLKEGDEVYLTEEQINEIIKRGGKLSYL